MTKNSLMRIYNKYQLIGWMTSMEGGEGGGPNISFGRFLLFDR